MKRRMKKLSSIFLVERSPATYESPAPKSSGECILKSQTKKDREEDLKESK